MYARKSISIFFGFYLLLFPHAFAGEITFYQEVTHPLNGIDTGGRSAPAFADIDNDGDPDVFIGEDGGAILFYENTGNLAEAVFEQKNGADNPLVSVNTVINSVPALTDIDNDGDVDAFIGGGDGRVLFYENTGTPQQPVFNPRTGSENPLDAISGGLNAAPAFVDIDADGDQDVFVGYSTASAGALLFYENTGSAAAPVFTERTGDANPFPKEFTDLPSPPAAFADLDHDGDPDALIARTGILFNDFDALDENSIRYYENTGTATAPVFERRFLRDNPFNRLSTTEAGGLETQYITLADIDGDGDKDAFTGSNSRIAGWDGGGTVLFFRNHSAVSEALPPGGFYRSAQAVKLDCLSCQAIHYTLDGSTPDLNAPVYTSPLSISRNTVLKYRLADALGRPGEVISETYYVDTVVPALSILSPQNDENLEVIGAVSGTASDDNAGLERVEVQITNGSQYLTPNGGFDATAHWLPATGTQAWSLDLSRVGSFPAGLYTVTVRAVDKAQNATQASVAVNTGLKFTTLTLSLNSRTILPNELDKLQIQGILRRLPEGDGPEVRNRPVRVTLTPQDGSPPITLDNLMTDETGHYYTDTFSIPLLPGGYTVQAFFAGADTLHPSQSNSAPLLVGTSAGYAVLVQGKVANNEGLEAHNKSLNRVYNQLLRRGFEADNIRYFNYDTTQAGVYAAPSKAAIREALADWVSAGMNGSPAPFYLIMVDHGTAGQFLLDDESLTPPELAQWLDTLETGLGAKASEQPRTVILGACFSGSFIPALSKPGRMIISSAAADEFSYKGVLEADGIRAGEYFIEALFLELGKGRLFSTAFENAVADTEIYTYSGDPSALNPFQDTAVQHPLLDDNGDSLGSNVLVAKQDGTSIASALVLGTGPDYSINFDGNPAAITAVTDTVYLSEADAGAVFSLTVNSIGKVENAFIEIRRPVPIADITAIQSDVEQLELNLEQRFLQDVDSVSRTYTGAYTHFDAPGKYDVFYYVQDHTTQQIDPATGQPIYLGDISPARHSTVYKNYPGNVPPAAFSLSYPADRATVQTTLIFDWRDSADEDGVTYNLFVATDAAMQHIVHKQEGLKFSSAYMDDNSLVWDGNTYSSGLKDLTAYYWQVEAVDGFGLRTLSDIRMLTTDNPSYGLSIFSFEVIDEAYFSAITNAIIEASQVFRSVRDGKRHTMALPPGEQTLTFTAPGYEPFDLTTTIEAGQSYAVTVSLTPVNSPPTLPQPRFSAATLRLNIPYVGIQGTAHTFDVTLRLDGNYFVLENIKEITGQTANEAVFYPNTNELFISRVNTDLPGNPQFSLKLMMQPSQNGSGDFQFTITDLRQVF